MKKYVYLFNEGDSGMGNILGGKGANLAEMTNLKIPVPPGFTISTEVCTYFMNTGKYPPGFKKQVFEISIFEIVFLIVNFPNLNQELWIL